MLASGQSTKNNLFACFYSGDPQATIKTTRLQELFKKKHKSMHPNAHGHAQAHPYAHSLVLYGKVSALVFPLESV
jgi:hypothetical protein